MRRRVQQWFLNRLPPTDTLTLTQRNVYILPTRAGWMLAFTLLVLLVGSINYQLNLGYLLTFLLAGCAVVGMHVCHANLRGLTLHLAPPLPVHAGQAVALEVRLSNDRKKPRHGIGLGVKTDRRLTEAQLAWADVPAQGSELLHVAWAPARRGSARAAGAHGRHPVSSGHLSRVDRLATPCQGAGVPGDRSGATAPASGRAPTRPRRRRPGTKHRGV